MIRSRPNSHPQQKPRTMARRGQTACALALKPTAMPRKTDGQTLSLLLLATAPAPAPASAAPQAGPATSYNRPGQSGLIDTPIAATPTSGTLDFAVRHLRNQTKDLMSLQITKKTLGKTPIRKAQKNKIRQSGAS